MKIKAVPAKRREPKNRSESIYSCEGCIGLESEEKCLECGAIVANSKLPTCTRGFIYVEVEKQK